MGRMRQPCWGPRWVWQSQAALETPLGAERLTKVFVSPPGSSVPLAKEVHRECPSLLFPLPEPRQARGPLAGALRAPGRCSHSGRPGLGTAGVAGGLPPPAQECPEWLLPQGRQAHVTWADGPMFREMPARRPGPGAPGAAPGPAGLTSLPQTFLRSGPSPHPSQGAGHPARGWLSAAACGPRPSSGQDRGKGVGTPRSQAGTLCGAGLCCSPCSATSRESFVEGTALVPSSGSR